MAWCHPATKIMNLVNYLVDMWWPYTNNDTAFWHVDHIEGILPKGPYPPCLRMADRTLLAGYPRYISVLITCILFIFQNMVYAVHILIYGFCPQPHTIIANDYSFAGLVSGVIQPYGQAGDCLSDQPDCHNGNMTVNLTGTGFTIHQEVGLV